jgi:hypothetical protein
MIKPTLGALRVVLSKLCGRRSNGDREKRRLETIRGVMLQCLDLEAKRRFPKLERRITYADSLPALWFLRPELLMALATHAGEQAAQQTLHEISRMFEGLLPRSLSTRPSFQAR